ncbi:MAG TPA: hypothetical protein VGA19_08475, partial [Rhodospirillales bacterium]
KDYHDAERDPAVGEVENVENAGPEEMEIEIVDHEAFGVAVPDIAQRPAQDHRQAEYVGQLLFSPPVFVQAVDPVRFRLRKFFKYRHFSSFRRIGGRACDR